MSPSGEPGASVVEPGRIGAARRLSIGFLGTGIMGGHMARRIAQAGHDVAAWNRTGAKAEALSAFGVAQATNTLTEGVVARVVAEHGLVRSALRQTTCVVEQILHSDARGRIRVGHTKPGQVPMDRRGEVYLALFHELHDGYAGKGFGAGINGKDAPVGDDDDGAGERGQARQGRQRTRQEDGFADGLDVVGAIFDDDAVAVEKDGASQAGKHPGSIGHKARGLKAQGTGTKSASYAAPHALARFCTFTK